ncbi:hypothetical protein [Sorangium cellulosum]|uniref:Uncharacterized protein n=1 Tax=Sorangium cellulosum TaxID=56 RepID=A0A150QVM3_SORCE|nr:hypothetical protein [Sorangium cellulosum]KYF72065.1 hypothetical protein BE15_45410 [Sorangium cellulosum]
MVDDATDLYANKPVEEILLSPAFDGAQPFGEEISRLIEERKAAFEAGDDLRRQEIEGQLKDKNPGYFSYIDVEERLQALRGETSPSPSCSA